MRWKEYQAPEIGTIRICEEFLLFPYLIAGEWRWMERAKWEEKYVSNNQSWGNYAYWKRMRWLN